MCRGGCFNRKMVRQEWNTCSRGSRLLFLLLFHSFFLLFVILPTNLLWRFHTKYTPCPPPPPPPCMCVHAHTHTHTCMCTHTQACLRACMHAHTHSLTHTSIHTHTVSQIHLTPPHHPTLISFISGDHTNVPPPSSTCLPCLPPPPPPPPPFSPSSHCQGQNYKEKYLGKTKHMVYALFFFFFLFKHYCAPYLPPLPTFSDDDVEFLHEEKPTAEQVERARKLLLPDAFYLYENRPGCPGCIGCEDYDPSKSLPVAAAAPRGCCLGGGGGGGGGLRLREKVGGEGKRKTGKQRETRTCTHT